MGYTSCKADPDLWYKVENRPDDNYRYYVYILCYVDDILVIHHDSMSVLNQIEKYLPLKPTSVGDPDIYLGAKLKETQLPNGIWAWGLSPSNYVNQAVKNCQTHLTEKLNGRYFIPAKAENPFPGDYNPDTGVSTTLDPECSSFYMHLIGVMRWMVELGRVDIATEVSMLSSYLAMPREGHLETALHIMGYLRKKHNSRLVFDSTYPVINKSDFPEYDWTEFYGDVTEAIPTDLRKKHNSRLIFDSTYPEINKSDFPEYDWTEFYGDVTEAIPPDQPEPLGKAVDIRLIVDSDHTGCKRTRLSRTGFLIYCNLSLIIWLSKKQPTLETSVFGTEFVAMKHGIETLRGLRYKLRMMGVPVSGPSYVYGDNKSQVTNSTRTESTLQKKCNSICCHAIRESVAMGETLITHIGTHDNLSDPLTKSTSGIKRRRFFGSILYDLYDDHTPKQSD